MSTHRRSNDPTYRAWQRMKTACTNKNHPSYKTYGARGIKFDPKWEKFTNFAKDMGDIPEECTGLELINLDADFSKFNCRWVNKKTRRSLSDMPNQSNKGRKRKYLNPRSVAVVLENKYFEFVQKMAISKSQEMGRPVSTSEFISMILEERCPMNKQLDLF